MTEKGNKVLNWSVEEKQEQYKESSNVSQRICNLLRTMLIVDELKRLVHVKRCSAKTGERKKRLTKG